MAVLMGVLAPTLIGNIEKSRETKDLQAIDSVYQAVNHALSTEAGAKEAAKKAIAGVDLATLMADTTNYPTIAAELKEELGSAAPDLSAAVNASAKIYITVDSTSLKSYVFCSADGTAVTVCTKTKDSSGKFKNMEVGTKASTTTSGS